MNSIYTVLRYFIIFGTIFSIFVVAAVRICQQAEIDVINGDKTLICKFSDGWRIIPTKKIVGLNYDIGNWSFTDGQGIKCDII